MKMKGRDMICGRREWLQISTLEPLESLANVKPSNELLDANHDREIWSPEPDLRRVYYVCDATAFF